MRALWKAIDEGKTSQKTTCRYIKWFLRSNEISPPAFSYLLEIKAWRKSHLPFFQELNLNFHY
jgi:hypothetical protein